MRIGFVGTGVMGRSMVRHLLKAGHELFIYNRTKAKAQPLVEEGAVWCASPGDAAADADIVMTIVGYPQDVEAVYFGENGIIARAKSGAILVDLTTSKPSLARNIYEAAKTKGLHALDAPVSGGDIGARDGTLTIMVGGDAAAFSTVEPVLACLGTNIILQGDAGAGQHTKMCNQIAIASNMMGVCEAIIYAERSGLDPKRVLQSIAAGAAGSWSLSNLAPRMLDGNFDPGFYVKHFIKDMGIALEAATEMALELPGLSLAMAQYEKLTQSIAGSAEDGTQALYKLYKH